MSSVTNLSGLFDTFLKVLSDAIGYRCGYLTCGLTREERARLISILSLFHQRVLRHARRFKRFAEAEDPASLNPRPRRRRKQDPEQPERIRPAQPQPVLPRRFGWLRQLIPDPAAFPGASQAGGYLLMVLRDPELKTLLETCPTLARSLRPLCHALGIRDLGMGIPLPFPIRALRKRASQSPAKPAKPSKPKPRYPAMPPAPQPQPPASRPSPHVFLNFAQKSTA